MRAQTGLEYLIILAAIIIIASACVYLISDNSSENRDSLLFRSCQQAASQCRILKALNDSADCFLCDLQCVDNGLDLITNKKADNVTGAVGCCMAGEVEGIFEGSEELCTGLP
jgi:hypothetical protein